jgi:hypothetical protein
MSLNDWQEADRVSLQAFYGSGQTWSFDDIIQGASVAGRSVRAWLESSPVPRGTPLLLPALPNGVEEPQWFAISFSERQAEELREQLNSFLGPAGSDYDGRRATATGADPLLRTAETWAGGSWIFRFSALPGFRQPVREALGRMQEVWSLRPTDGTKVSRSTEALLRDFFSTLANRDEHASRRVLDSIRASGRLSPENAQFLEIERLAALDQWSAIALHPLLPMLAEIRRPQRITAFLIEALWRTEFERYFQEDRAAEALAFFRASFAPRYKGLLRARGSLRQESVVLTFLLAAVGLEPPRPEQIPLLLDRLEAGSKARAFADAIATHVRPGKVEKVPTGPLEKARRALERKEFDTAWLHLRDAPVSAESCELLLDCAIELASPEVARHVIDAFARLDEKARRSVLGLRRHARTWEELERLLAPAGALAPVDWETWLDAVEADPKWRGAIEAARDGIANWEIQPYRDEPKRPGLLADRLQGSRDPDARQLIRLVYPHITRFFLPDGTPERMFSSVYQSILFALAVDDRFGAEDWATAQNLALAVLECAPSTDDYANTLEVLSLLWQNRGDVTRLDWGLDLLDTVAVLPPLSEIHVDSFFTAVWNTFNSHSRRVGREQRELFGLLCDDLGRSAEFAALPPIRSEAESPTIDVAGLLRGKMVAIYTLTESAGLRAKRTLESIYIGIDVRLSHDHGGSERLRSLAREADYFVMSTRSATHAATDFIKSNRTGARSGLIFPAGKGSSSVVTAVREAALSGMDTD